MDEVEKKVRILQRQKWNIAPKPSDISRSTQWQTDNLLGSSHVVLLMDTADFLDTDLCYSNDVKDVVNQHRDQTYVLPILFQGAASRYLTGTPFATIPTSPCQNRAVDEFPKRSKAMDFITQDIINAIKTMLPSSLCIQ